MKVVGFTNNDKVHGNIVRCNRDLGELKKDLLSLIKPQLKEESPKEDEVEELFKIIQTWRRTSEGYIYWESWADEPQISETRLIWIHQSQFCLKGQSKERVVRRKHRRTRNNHTHRSKQRTL